MNSETKQLITLAGIAAGMYVGTTYILPNLIPEPYLVPKNVSDGTYAFATNESGVTMYAKTNAAKEPLYGHGRNPLANKIEAGKYIGKLTGITFHELVQVRTQIDDKPYSFWVNKNDIRISALEETVLDETTKKEQSDLKNIVHSLIDQII